MIVEGVADIYYQCSIDFKASRVPHTFLRVRRVGMRSSAGEGLSLISAREGFDLELVLRGFPQ